VAWIHLLLDTHHRSKYSFYKPHAEYPTFIIDYSLSFVRCFIEKIVPFLIHIRDIYYVPISAAVMSGDYIIESGSSQERPYAGNLKMNEVLELSSLGHNTFQAV